MSHFLKDCTIECNPSLLRLCLFLLILLQHLSRLCSLSIILKQRTPSSPKCPYLPLTLSSFSIHSSRKDCMPCLTSSALSSLSPREPIASPPDLSVSRGFPALTFQSLQWPFWAPLLFDLVSHSAVSLSGAYMLVLPGFPPHPLIFSQSFPLFPAPIQDFI